MVFRREGVPMGLPGLDEWHIQQTDTASVRAARQVLDDLDVYKRQHYDGAFFHVRQCGNADVAVQPIGQLRINLIRKDVYKRQVYRYDGTFQGFLCCIFESYSRKEIHAAVCAPDRGQISFYDSCEIVTDPARAQRVARGLELSLIHIFNQSIKLKAVIMPNNIYIRTIYA